MEISQAWGCTEEAMPLTEIDITKATAANLAADAVFIAHTQVLHKISAWGKWSCRSQQHTRLH